MNNPIFSIVVPIYNVEKYLPQCLESITRQAFKDYEVILVDDGSTDKCPDICDEFKVKESRCKVIHQTNKGLSGARNTGMGAATGRYIYFMDSDDTISSNLLDELQKILHKYEVDIIGFNATVIEANRRSVLSTGKCINKIEYGIEIAQKRVPLSTVPLYCYRRSFLLKEKLLFEEGIYYEDIFFTALAFLKNPTIYYMDKALYFYNKRGESITTSKVKIKNYCDLVKICNCLIDNTNIEQGSCLRNAYQNILKTYLMLSEEIYRMMELKDRKEGVISRINLMKKVRSQRKQVGLKSYAIACFPSLFYFIRGTRRMIRWQE